MTDKSKAKLLVELVGDLVTHSGICFVGIALEADETGGGIPESVINGLSRREAAGLLRHVADELEKAED